MKSTRSILAAAAVFASSMFGSPAHARIISALAGKPLHQAQSSCFDGNFGAVTNTCGGNAAWFIPFIIDAPGTYSPSYEVFAPSAAKDIECMTIGVNYNNDPASILTGSATGSPSQFGTTVRIQPGALSVQEGGILFGVCWMDQGSFLHNVVW